MSFVRYEGKLYACPLSTLNSQDYFILEYTVKEESDKRKTKYAPERVQALSSGFQKVMGNFSAKTLLTRLQIIQQISKFSTGSMDTS